MKRYLSVIPGIAVILLFSASLWGQTSLDRTVQVFFNSGSADIRPYAVLQVDTNKTRWTTIDTIASLSTNTSWLTYQTADTAGDSTGTYNKGKLSVLSDVAGGPFYIYARGVTTASTDTLIIYGYKADNPYVDKGDSSAISDSLVWASGVTELRSKYVWSSIDSVCLTTMGAGLDSVIFWYRNYFGACMADSSEAEILGVSVGTNRYYNSSAANDTVASDAWGYVAISGAAKTYGTTDGNARYINAGDKLVIGVSGMVMRPHQAGIATGTDTTTIRNWILKNKPDFSIGRALTPVDSIAGDSTLMWLNVNQ